MPHIIIEYSPNIAAQVKATKALALVHQIFMDSGLFSIDAIKTRAYQTEDFALGDKGSNASFIHVSAYILDGRSLEEKQRLSEAVCHTLKEKLETVNSISTDIREMSKEIYRKVTL